MSAHEHLSPEQFPVYEVGDPATAAAGEHRTAYDFSARVHPSTFGMQIRSRSERPAFTDIEWGPDTVQQVPVDKVWGTQDYVYGPHVHNLASVPADRLPPVDAYQQADGSYQAMEHHRVAAALARGDQTVALRIRGRYR